MSETPGEKDLADFTITPPPPGWTPDVVDGEPDAADVRDLNEEAGE